MAKGDLYRAIQRARELLEVDTKEYRKQEINKIKHEYTVTSTEIRHEVYLEIEKVLGVPNVGGLIKSNTYISITLGFYIAKYMEDLKKEIIRASSSAKVFSAKIKSIGDGYIVTVTSDDPNSDIYEWIRRRKIEAKRALIASLEKNTIPSVEKALRMNSSSKINDVEFLDIGHKHAVVDLQTAEALHKIRMVEKRNPEVSQIVPDVIRLMLASKHYGTYNKVFTVYVSDESAKENRRKGDIEKARQAQVKAVLEKWSKENDWAKQKGSDSVLEILEKSIILEAAKSKAYRGPKPKKVDRSNNSVSTSLTSKTKVSKSKDTLGIQGIRGPSRAQATKPQGSALDLVTLINAKLTEEVRKRMTYPRLENRTGRFASSVQVTDVIQTAGGFPSIGYTYMRNPYETFEPGRKQGSLDRDPKRLINESIRAIAGEYLQGRFFTRRV
jgi:hypothetical protein